MKESGLYTLLTRFMTQAPVAKGRLIREKYVHVFQIGVTGPLLC